MGINLKGVIKGTLFSVIVTFVIILILSLLSYLTNIDESIINTAVYASVIIGVLLGTIAVSKSAAGKVLLHSMLVCVMYAIVLTGISFIVNKGVSFNMHLLTILAGIFASGFIGAVIGK